MSALLSYAADHALAWAAAALVAVAAGAAGVRWHRAVGVGLMTVPLGLVVASFIEDVGALVGGGTVLQPLSRFQLSGQYLGAVLNNVGYVLAGATLFASQGTRQGWRELSPRRVAVAARDAGVPVGKGEARSIAAGFAWFPVLLAANLALLWVTSRSSALRNGDDSQVFANMTVFHAVMISLAAAVGEELLFRGFLQTAVARGCAAASRLMRPTEGVRELAFAASPGTTAQGVAIVVQAVFFAIAHAGYGNWEHVLFPFLFGLVAGLAALRWGIWCALILHFMVDVTALGAETAASQPWAGKLLASLLLADLLFAIAYGFSLVRARNRPPASAS